MGWQDDPVVSAPAAGKASWQDDPVVEGGFGSTPGGAAIMPTPQRARPVNTAPGGALVGGANRGIVGLAGLPVDTAENIVNLGIAGGGGLYQAATGRPGPDLIRGTPGGSESLEGVMNRLGILTSNPQPGNAGSEMLYRAGTILPSMAIPGAGVRSTLAAATGSAVGEQVAGPEGAMIGAMVPGAGVQAGRDVASLYRGSAREARVADKVNQFRQATGGTPTVGQATESTFIQGMENLLAKYPGGQSVFQRFIDKQQSGMGEKAATGTTAERAGREIQSGITREGGFLDRTRATFQGLDEAIWNKIPSDARVPIGNTFDTLKKLTAVTPGAEASTGTLVNPLLKSLHDNLAKDLNAARQTHPYGGAGAVIPVGAMREIRTKIGSLMDDSLVSGVPSGELKQVYGALSKDIEIAAGANGAGPEFARMNKYWTARQKRVEGALSRVLGPKDASPESIMERAMPKNVDQQTDLLATMRSLTPSERSVVTSAVGNRLGRASPGKQDELGEVFSSETLLTNWNKLNPRAKAVLAPDAQLRDAWDNLALTAADIRKSGRAFTNPSGTASSLAGQGLMTSPIRAIANAFGSVVSGVSVGVTAGGSALTARVTAKMLTNPETVNWLAGAMKAPPKNFGAHAARLGVIFNETKDEALKKDLGAFMQSIQ